MSVELDTPRKFNEVVVARRGAPGRLKAKVHQALGSVGLEAKPVGVEGRRTGMVLKASRKKDADDLDNVLDFFGHEEGIVPRRRAPVVISRVELAPVVVAPVKPSAGPTVSGRSPRGVSPGGDETPRSSSRTATSTAATPSSRSASRTQNTSVSSTGSPLPTSPPPEPVPRQLDFDSVDNSMQSPSSASAANSTAAGKSSNASSVDFFSAPSIRQPTPSRPVAPRNAAPASSTKIILKKPPQQKQAPRILENLNLSTASPSSASPSVNTGSESPGAQSGFGSPGGFDLSDAASPSPTPAPAAKPSSRQSKRVSFHADPRKQKAPAASSNRRTSVGGDADQSLPITDETYQEDASWVLSDSVAAAEEEEAAKDKRYVPELDEDEHSGEEIVGDESGEPDFVIGEDGARKSTRFRSQPLQYWKGDKVVYGRRKSGTFPTVVDVEKHQSPAPAEKEKPVKKRKGAISTQQPNAEASKFPETDQPILVPVWDEKAGKEVMKEVGRPASACPISPGKVPLETKASTILKGDLFSTRMIVLSPLSATASQKSDSTKIFYVVSGVLETEINKVKAILHAGAHFSVPAGSDLILRNPQQDHPTSMNCTTLKAAASSDSPKGSKKKKASSPAEGASEASKKKKTAAATDSSSKKKKK